MPAPQSLPVIEPNHNPPPPQTEPPTWAWRHAEMATKPSDTEASKEVSKAVQETNLEDVGDVPDPDEDDLDDLDGM